MLHSHRANGPYRQFWFPATRGGGIGVTACSELEALQLALNALPLLPAGAVLTGEPVLDVDVAALDPEHIRPRMGEPATHGVWFPRFSA